MPRTAIRNGAMGKVVGNVAKMFKTPKLLKPPPGGVISNPNGAVAPGYGAAYDASGKPTALGRINQPSPNSKVGLAAGVGVQYDAQGRPIGFVNVSKKTGQVTGPYGQSNAPAAPAAPGAQGTPPRDVRDADYYATLAEQQHARSSQLADLGLSDTRQREDAQTSLQRLSRQYAQATQNANESANSQGLFYSGILGKRLGDLESSRKDTETDINVRLARALADSETRRRELYSQFGTGEGGDYGIQGAKALAAATGRHLADPLAETPPPGVTPAAPAASVNIAATNPGPINKGGSGLGKNVSVANGKFLYKGRELTQGQWDKLNRGYSPWTGKKLKG